MKRENATELYCTNAFGNSKYLIPLYLKPYLLFVSPSK